MFSLLKQLTQMAVVAGCGGFHPRALAPRQFAGPAMKSTGCGAQSFRPKSGSIFKTIARPFPGGQPVLCWGSVGCQHQQPARSPCREPKLLVKCPYCRRTIDHRNAYTCWQIPHTESIILTTFLGNEFPMILCPKLPHWCSLLA